MTFIFHCLLAFLMHSFCQSWPSIFCVCLVYGYRSAKKSHCRSLLVRNEIAYSLNTRWYIRVMVLLAVVQKVTRLVIVLHHIKETCNVSKSEVTKCRKNDVCVIVVMQMCDHVWSLSMFHSSKQADDEMQCSRGETCPVTKVCVCVCVSHWWSSRAWGAFAVLGAGAGFRQGRAVYLLPLDDHSMMRMTQRKNKSK